jgi:hypothetical protein
MQLHAVHKKEAEKMREKSVLDALRVGLAKLRLQVGGFDHSVNYLKTVTHRTRLA